MAIGSRAVGRLARFLSIALVAATAVLAAAPAEAGRKQAAGFSDEQLMDGFRRTVFGVEFGSRRYGTIVKKYQGAVSFAIVGKSAIDRTGTVGKFVRSLPGMIRGLKTTIVADPDQAAFTVLIVDRASYVETVRADVLGSHAAAAPGSCLVKVDVGSSGIRRSVAVVVSDEGEALFRRCMTEEILQGLGPMNDDASLMQSVFNDRTDYARFMPFDRAILNMLYDPRVRHGMSKAEIAEVLPDVTADVRKRLR